MDYTSALNWLEHILKPKYSHEAKLEAQTLLSFYLDIPLPSLSQKKDFHLSEVQYAELETFAKRRADGEPLQYILGRCEFLGLKLKVGPGVLIPRLDSEAMVLKGIEHLKHIEGRELKVLDLGAGSGALGLAVISRIPEAQLLSIEVSPTAREYFEENTASLGLTTRVSLVDLNLDDEDQLNKWKQTAGTFDLIIANPPYIDRADPDLDLNVKSFEPNLALYADEQGLEKIISWSQRLVGLLSLDGIYLCEIGWKQAEAVSAWYLKNFVKKFDFNIHKDLSGKDRFFQLSTIR